MSAWHRADWFSFFQAIGSVVAIFAAGAIAGYQGYSSRKIADSQKAAQDKTLRGALVGYIQECEMALRQLAEGIADSDARERIRNSFVTVRIFDALDANMERFPAYLLPTSDEGKEAYNLRLNMRLLHAYVRFTCRDEESWGGNRESLELQVRHLLARLRAALKARGADILPPWTPPEPEKPTTPLETIFSKPLGNKQR
ncbi:MAG: hypothetical protein WDN30_14240 [Pararobbsia sp.]